MKKKPAKPTPRGLAMLRILDAAWETKLRAPGSRYRGSVYGTDLAARLYSLPAGEVGAKIRQHPPVRWLGRKHTAAIHILATLAHQQLAGRATYLGPFWITAAGRAAVKRAEGQRA